MSPHLKQILSVSIDPIVMILSHGGGGNRTRVQPHLPFRLFARIDRCGDQPSKFAGGLWLSDLRPKVFP